MILLMYKLCGCLILGILLLGCEKGSFVADTSLRGEQEVTQKTDLQAEDYEVYSALIDKMYARDEVTSLVIFNQTTSYVLPYKDLNEALRNINERVPGGIANEVIEDFSTKNKLPRTLHSRFSVKVPYTLLNKEDLNSIFQQSNGWSEFLRRYPKQSLLEFSGIGFNPEMNQALVYTSTESGGKSGSGYYVLLTKENGNWSIKYKFEAWTS